VQAIIVDPVPVVNPQLASIIGNNAETIGATLVNSVATRPTNREMITASETRPLASCVSIVYYPLPSSHVWSATMQIRTPTTLTKIEGVLHEETMAISGAMRNVPSATCADDQPSVSSVATPVSEKHAS
jgi:hypothetical protein